MYSTPCRNFYTAILDPKIWNINLILIIAIDFGHTRRFPMKSRIRKLASVRLPRQTIHFTVIRKSIVATAGLLAANTNAN